VSDLQVLETTILDYAYSNMFSQILKLETFVKKSHPNFEKVDVNKTGVSKKLPTPFALLYRTKGL
jgi:hypothetical protein